MLDAFALPRFAYQPTRKAWTVASADSDPPRPLHGDALDKVLSITGVTLLGYLLCHCCRPLCIASVSSWFTRGCYGSMYSSPGRSTCHISSSVWIDLMSTSLDCNIVEPCFPFADAKP